MELTKEDGVWLDKDDCDTWLVDDENTDTETLNVSVVFADTLVLTDSEVVGLNNEDGD